MNYYNDNDPNSAATLRELIRRGLISNGIVDDRSILDVQPGDLRGFTQCHFFAGAGVWSYALRIAGWPDDWPVWTGSPPCQPFSVAGKQDGRDDARHLAPKFASLVGACRPAVLFGEQVASAAVFGPSAKGNRPGFEGPPPWAWLDDLFDRLEAAHYAVGANDVPNAGVGAPHIRQRTYFGAIRLAYAASAGYERGRSSQASDGRDAPWVEPERLREVVGLADNGGIRRFADNGPGAGVGAQEGSRDPTQQRKRIRPEPSASCDLLGGLADGLGAGLEGHSRDGDDRGQSGRLGTHQVGPTSSGGESHALDDRRRPGPTNGFWRDADWLFCRDEQWRPVEPGTFPLAHGSPARVGRLRLYGNAINPRVAKIHIEAFCEAVGIPLARNGVASSGLNNHL